MSVNTLEVAEKMYGKGSIAYEFVRTELELNALLADTVAAWSLDGVTVEVVGDVINITGHATLPGKIQETTVSFDFDFGGPKPCPNCDHGNGSSGVGMFGMRCYTCNGSKVEPAG